MSHPTAIHALCGALLGLVCVTATYAQGLEMIDDGAGTRQVVTDGETVYALKDTGQVWARENGRWALALNESGTRQIAAGAGRAYALGADGRLYRRTFGKWSALALKGSRQITVAGKDVFTLENNDDIWMFSSSTGGWTKVDNGTRTVMISADAQSGMYVLKQSGVIFRHTGGMNFEQVDNGANTRQIVAADGGVFVLKDNGNVWRIEPGRTFQVDDGLGTRQIAAGGGTLCCLKDDGKVWMNANGKWAMIYDGSDVKSIEVGEGLVVLLKNNGNLFAAPVRALAQAIQVNNFNVLHQN